MKKVIGSEICVLLKSEAGAGEEIYGLLIDFDEDSLYLQGSDVRRQTSYVIPRDNVKYCTTKVIKQSRLEIACGEEVDHVVENVEPEEQAPTELSVYISGELTATIPVPPTCNLMVWSDNIMKIALGNPDVKACLRDKVQNAAEYWPGELHIGVTDAPQESDSAESFTMSESEVSPQTHFLSPSQMIEKLNSAARRKKNE